MAPGTFKKKIIPVMTTILLAAMTAAGAQVTLRWTAPTHNVDGSSLSDLAGYKVYGGFVSRQYTAVVDAGNATNTTLTDLADDRTYYFAVTSYDADGTESAFSQELAWTPAPIVVSATHACGGYSPSSTASVQAGFEYPQDRQLLSLLWTPALPAGWTLSSVSGNGAPEISGNSIVFTGDLSANPLTFTFQVSVPAGESGTRQISSAVQYTLSGMTNPDTVAATPDPLTVDASLLLSVASAHGGADPAAGNHAMPYGSTVVCSITNSPCPGSEGERFVCSGWTGTGSAPASGQGTSASFTIVQDSSITWQWGAEYLFSASAGNGGQVTSADTWCRSGTSASATATPMSGFTFAGWSGDVPAGQEKDNPITVTMNQPRSLTATFAVDPSAVTASQACAGFRSPSAGTTVNGSFAWPSGATIESLSWTCALPQGWTLASASGSGNPQVSGNRLVFSGPFTQNPATFTYTVSVPGNEPVTNTLSAVADFQLQGMSAPAGVAAAPDPLLVKRWHSADYADPFNMVDPTEVNRVLAYWRAGGYCVDPRGYDGYAPTNTPDTSAADQLHSADYAAPYCAIDAAEAGRVLAYWRAGGYQADETGVDGYAPVSSTVQSLGLAGASAVSVSASQAAATYNPGQTFAVTNTLSYTGQLLSLWWRPHLPAGFVIASVSGDGNPELNRGEILWVGELPPSPIEMVYTVQAPVSAAGDVEITSDVSYFLSDASNPADAALTPSVLAVSPADADADGLPDGWESLYGDDATGLDPAQDSDGDGMSNYAEYLAGTSPGDPGSMLALTQVAAVPGEAPVIRWQSVEGRSYTLLKSTSLEQGFTPVATAIPATPPENTYTDSDATGQAEPCFYRVRLD